MADHPHSAAALSALIEYDHWANQRIAVALLDLSRPESGLESVTRAEAIFAHLVAAHRVWQARCREMQGKEVLWPSPRLDAFERELETCRTGWAELLVDPGPNAIVRYHNTRGQRFENRMADVVIHVVTHGNYHRGQIGLLLGRSNVAAPATDYIHAVRTGQLPAAEAASPGRD